MTEWREVPEITEEHIGWTVAVRTDRKRISDVGERWFYGEGNDRIWWTEGPWIVKPPEKEKPKPEPHCFWWVKSDNGEWKLYGPAKNVFGSINFDPLALVRPAKPDKDGMFWPPDQKPRRRSE